MKLGVDQHRGSNFFKPYFRFKKIMMIPSDTCRCGCSADRKLGSCRNFSLLKFPVKVNYTLTWPRSEKPAIYKILLSKALKVSIGGISPKCPWRALLCKNLCFSKLWTSAFFKFRHMKWCHLPDIFRKDFKSSFWKCKNWKS